MKEENPAAEIHQRLQRAYGSVCMGASSVLRYDPRIYQLTWCNVPEDLNDLQRRCWTLITRTILYNDIYIKEGGIC